MEPEQLYELIKQNKDAILQDEDSGHSDAKAIVSSYNLLVRHFDWCALGILEGSFEKWAERRNSDALVNGE